MVQVIVVFPKQEDANNIRSLLIRRGYSVIGTCTTGAQAIQYTDQMDDGIVVCGYKYTDMMYLELREYLPREFEMLLITSKNLWDECAGNDIVCLAMPIKAYDLFNTLEMLVQNLYRRRKKRKTKPKKRTKEEIKIIKKAKFLLMERNNMTEEEAHRYLQKCSMDSGNSMAESARMVFQIIDL